MYPVPKHYLPGSAEPLAPRRVKRRKLVFRPRPGTFLVMAVVGYILFSFGHLAWSIRQIEAETAAYEQQKQELLTKAREMEALKQELQSRAYVERVAREQLGLVYPGEKVLVRALPGEVLPLEPSDPQVDIRD